METQIYRTIKTVLRGTLIALSTDYKHYKQANKFKLERSHFNNLMTHLKALEK